MDMVKEIVQIALQAHDDCEGLEIPFTLNVKVPNPEAFSNEALNELIVLVETALTRTCLEIRDQSHALIRADVDGPAWLMEV